MRYTPTQWKDGDLVTSAKLNKMEQGIAAGSGILVVHKDENNRLDRTWQEIYDADFAIIQLIENNTKSNCTILTGIQDNIYYVQPSWGSQSFIASTPDDYPMYYEESGGGEK